MPLLFVQLLEVLEDRMRQHRIERGNRLVGQDQLRLLHQRARNADPLLLPARQRIGAHVSLVAQAQLVEVRQRALAIRRRKELTGSGRD